MASSCSEGAAIPAADTAEEGPSAPAVEAPAVVDAPEPPVAGALPAQEWPLPPWISADGSTLACPFSPALSGSDEPHLVFIRAEDGAFLRSMRREDAAPILARDGYTRLEVLNPPRGRVPIRVDLEVELEEGARVRPPINARGVLLEGPGRTAITLRDANRRARFRAWVSNQPPRFARIPRHCRMSFFPDFVPFVWVDAADLVVLVDQHWRSGSDECNPWRWVLGRMGGGVVSQIDESHPSLRWMSEQQHDE